MNGGARPGAGRKKGNRKAEIAKGLAQAKAIATAEQILGDGLTPLQFMIQVMRDEAQDIKTRLMAAQDAATFCHQRKPQDQNIHHSGVYAGIAFDDP